MFSVFRWGRTALLAAVVALLGTGCFSFIPDTQKARVTHSPLPAMSVQRKGGIVLRESADTFRKPYKVIGSKALEAQDLAYLLTPFAAPANLIEIRGAKSAHEVLRSSLAEALQQAGYTVHIHKKADQPLPKKWRGAYRIVEFDLTEFCYEYGAKKPEPNSQEIDLTVRLLDKDGVTGLWSKRYRTIVRDKTRDCEGTIRRAMDEVLNEALQDFASEDFRNLAVGAGAEERDVR